MMKTSSCLHIVAVYDNTMSGFISWRYTGGPYWESLTLLTILESHVSARLCFQVLVEIDTFTYIHLKMFHINKQ
jgi:hypothetical protein